MTIKAIETIYNGYRFRSRLEARWAVFFDTLGIKYEYEKEGYDLSTEKVNVYYLPDFWLPEQKCFVEVKGSELLDIDSPASLKEQVRLQTVEMFKAKWLAEHSNYAVYICYGSISNTPDIRMFTGNACDFCMKVSWYQCCLCEKFVIWPCYSSCGCYDPYKEREDGIFPYENGDKSPRLLAAYTTARQARFEHGEKG